MGLDDPETQGVSKANTGTGLASNDSETRTDLASDTKD